MLQNKTRWLQSDASCCAQVYEKQVTSLADFNVRDSWSIAAAYVLVVLFYAVKATSSDQLLSRLG